MCATWNVETYTFNTKFSTPALPAKTNCVVYSTILGGKVFNQWFPDIVLRVAAQYVRALETSKENKVLKLNNIPRNTTQYQNILKHFEIRPKVHTNKIWWKSDFLYENEGH